MADSTAPVYTLAEGVPYANATTAQHFGGNGIKGLMLLQDTQLLETLAHFNRERIPERVVHAAAVGAWGEFEVTHDVSELTDAKFLNGIGKKSQVLLRVSTVGPERGGADTIRDVRGWGMKIFTEEGNQDWVFNNIPVFFVRDPIKFPSLNRSHKRHPATNQGDSTMNGTFHYVKVHIKTDQGIENLTNDEAVRLAGEAPGLHGADLYEAIANGNFPSWTVHFQVMKPEQAENYRWNIFDMTKVWPHADFPLIPVGKITLNRNPGNYFADIEQAAFSPANMVPGWAPSADPMLQARMFAYNDAARYRLGVNYQQLPCNRAVSKVYCPFQRDGFMTTTDNYGGDPNYVGSDLKPIQYVGKVGANAYAIGGHEEWVGQVTGFTSQVVDDDFVQSRMFWDMLGTQEGQQDHFAYNAASHLIGALPSVQAKALQMFSNVYEEVAQKIAANITTIRAKHSKA
ncbi:hypothetical protein H072_2590 [Dactylellina haptotyla CBS 200.50]|uniref:Catalase core domain-containing protein n=1 Tax=Dactylellina haptotyla (strain CBS 200.50) TaxID=1284197 RepID=S8BV83_DACHA|nr:hypothetical protein H072_2590 [Dactylellina haptotyla CBS 200.50]